MSKLKYAIANASERPPFQQARKKCNRCEAITLHTFRKLLGGSVVAVCGCGSRNDDNLIALETELKTQPHEARCHRMKERHILPLKPACPYSGNPQAGSFIEIDYSPLGAVLEVASLRAYVDSYTGGRGDIRSMEGMIQQITQDCANAVQSPVWVKATLNIAPEQQMVLECSANVKTQSGLACLP